MTEDLLEEDYRRTFNEFNHFLYRIDDRREDLISKGQEPGKDMVLETWYARVDYLMGRLKRMGGF